VATPAVRLVGVRKSYREGAQARTILDGISGEIAPGSMVALLGRSGSGKSTLLNVLAGIDRVDSGGIEIAGTDIGRLGEGARTRFRRRRIGFVFQAFNLLPTLTVEENVLLRPALDGRLDAAIRRTARELLADIGLADRAGSFPDRLSGGEQQRVAVALALVHAPALVLADEPTGNLDQANAAIVMQLMLRLVRASGATLLIATHAAEVAAIADRTWTITDGRLS
jgi:putative ABC transport system ATP-binding protein